MAFILRFHSIWTVSLNQLPFTPTVAYCCNSRLWTRSCRRTERASGASRHFPHAVKDKLIDFSSRRYCFSWSLLMNISDEDPPPKNASKQPLTHQQTPSPNTSQCCTEIARQWETHTQTSGRCPSIDGLGQGFFDFSVMSYNILSQKLLDDNAHLYKHCSLPILDWNYRHRNIMKEIQKHNADIVCLQEVQEDHYETQVKPFLESLGYHCEYKKRTGKKSDGCAVVFKQETFSLVSCHPVEYFKPGIPLLDRHNVGLVLLLQPKVEKGITNRLCVANTHLLYNPRRGDIKLTQLGLLLAEISHVSKQSDGSTCPVILCGDLNSVPWSPLYRFIRDGKLEYHGMPIGKVSGQDDMRKGQRLLNIPLWPQCVGISQQCQYEDPPIVSRNCVSSRITSKSNTKKGLL